MLRVPASFLGVPASLHRDRTAPSWQDNSPSGGQDVRAHPLSCLLGGRGAGKPSDWKRDPRIPEEL